jgi:hypothetical protein
MSETRRSFVGNAWAIPAVIAIIHAFAAILAFHQMPFTGGDDATYISLAKSLLERHDYTDIWDPGLPPHTQYPPLFPLIVSGGLALGLTPPVGLKVLMIVITTLAIFASCVWLMRTTTPGVVLCTGLFIALSPEILRLGQEVLSDSTCWLFSVLALIAWASADKKALEGKDRGPMPVGLVVAAAAATLAAYFTRSAGAPLLIAVFIWLAIRRQYRAMVIMGAMAAPPIFLWWLHGHAHGAGGYLAPFLSVDPYNPSLGKVTLGELVKRVGENASKYGSLHLSKMVFGTPRTGLVFGATFALAMIYGWWKRARKPGLPEIWLPIYLALVMLWPVAWSGARFLFPVVPVIALYVGESLAELAKAASHPRIFAGALLVAGIITAGPDLRRQIKTGSVCRERYAAGDRFACLDTGFKDFFTVSEKTRGMLPANAVVISRKPTIFFLHSGYRSVVYPFFPVPDSLFNLASRTGAKYLVIDEIGDVSPRFLQPILLARRDDFCIIRELSAPAAAMARIEIGGPRRPDAAPNSFRTCPVSPPASNP